eukprot:m.12733 g.12733  ORF g.12733 m.12733 type:complete len:300 (-) comp10016_c0_seq1:8-907(-)
MVWRKWAVSGVGVAGYVTTRHFDSATQAMSPLHSTTVTDSSKDSSFVQLQQNGIAVIPEAGGQFVRSMLASSDYADFLKHHQQVRFGRNRDFRESTIGRYHRVSFSQPSQDAFRAFEEHIAPLVNQFFDLEGAETSTLDNQQLSSELVCSQRQLLVSDVDSACQFYHQDNSKQGLTLLIPMVDVAWQQGPTQLLPSSHILSTAMPWTTKLTRLHTSLINLGTVQCTARAGDVVAYDARTMHRGMSNRSDHPRPVLVVRFDRKESLPPGHGVMSTMAVRIGATLLGVYAHVIRGIACSVN